MADEPNARDAKLIQYLNEAYGKERQLETALQAHISMTTLDSYKKRLQEHLKETRAQAKGLERRIKQLGGKAEEIDLPSGVAEVATAAQSTARKAAELARGPLHALRGTGEAEKLLKNAKTQLSQEWEEIGNYSAIQALAEAVGDRDTAKLAKEFRRQEERMASFIEKLIPRLVAAVTREEIPKAERNGGAARKRGGTRRTTAKSSSSRSSSSRSSSARSTAKSGGSKSGSSRSAASRSGSRSTARSGGSKSGSSRSAASRSGSRSTAKASGSSRSASSRSASSKSGGSSRSGSSRSGSRSTAKRGSKS